MIRLVLRFFICLHLSIYPHRAELIKHCNAMLKLSEVQNLISIVADTIEESASPLNSIQKDIACHYMKNGSLSENKIVCHTGKFDVIRVPLFCEGAIHLESFNVLFIGH